VPPSAARKVRGRRPGFADDASVHRGERARSIARPFGPDRPPSTGAEGDLEARASRLPPLLHRSSACFCRSGGSRDASALCAQDARLLNGVPLRPGERVEDQPEGARARCARVRCGAWMGRQRTPEPDRAVSGQEPADRSAGGVFSFGSFSLDKHCAAGAARTAKLAPKGRRAGCPESRKGTGPQGCGTNTQGRGQVFGKDRDSAVGNANSDYTAKRPSLPSPQRERGSREAKLNVPTPTSTPPSKPAPPQVRSSARSHR
jgi:hypothetical protein